MFSPVNAVSQIVNQTQSHLQTIAKYKKIMKKDFSKNAKMKKLISDQIFISVFE